MQAARSSAWDLLHLGDAVRIRVARRKVPVALVADEAGITRSVATRASWLAGIYTPTERDDIGQAALGRLTPMHLEVAAQAPQDRRVDMLKSAAAEGLTARALRARVKAMVAEQAKPEATADAIEASTRAMEIYVGFSDQQLNRLITGPNGPKVRRAAAVGRLLADRIAEFNTT